MIQAMGGQVLLLTPFASQDEKGRELVDRPSWIMDPVHMIVERW